MQPIATITRHEAIDHDELPVRNWRVSQLKRAGIPGPLAEAYANHIDWHQATRVQEPAARHQPVLVILDLGHRELDSMEVIRRLRGCTEAPIIVLSGHASSIGEVVVMDAGASDYLSGPSSGAKIASRITRGLQAYRRRRRYLPGPHRRSVRGSGGQAGHPAAARQ